jgi:hypothetical protein
MQLMKSRGEKPAAVSERPIATLRQLTLEGSALVKSVELTVVFDIQLHEDQTDWVRIPLGLREAAWKKRAEYKGDGEQIVHFDREADEYVCWLKGKANSQHQITGRLSIPLNRVKQEKRLPLTLPWAGASSLQLTIPLPKTRVQITQSTDTPEPTTQENDEKNTRVNVFGLKGNYVLGWRELEKNTPSLRPVLEVTGLQLVRINGRSVTTDARLNIKSLSTSFDEIKVRLPPKSTLSNMEIKGCTITTVSDSSGEQLVVKFDEKLTNVVLPLQTERTVSDLMQPNETIELAGFSVEEALDHRQGGYLAVQVLGDWELADMTQKRATQVAEIPADFIIKDPNDPNAKDNLKDYKLVWEYVGQPFSLDTKIIPRVAHIYAEVDHKMQITSSQATLETTINYKIRGAKVNQLKITPLKWIIDKAEIPNIDSDPRRAPYGNQIVIPLSAPTNGDLTLKLSMHFNYASSKEKPIDFPIPFINAETIGSTSLTVKNSQNISVEPVVEKNTSLVRLPNSITSPAATDTEELESPTFRYRVDKFPAQFSAIVQPLSRHTSATISSVSEIDAVESRVVETIKLQAQYEPITQIKIFAPSTPVIRQSSLTFELDGKPLANLYIGLPQTDEVTRQTTWTLNLPEPRIGLVLLTVRYQLPHRLAPQASTPVTLPLLLPEVDQIARNEMTVHPSTNVQIGTSRLASKWTIVGPNDNPERLELRGKVLNTQLAPDQTDDAPTESVLTDELPLTLESAKTQIRPLIAVEDAWLQTELIQGERQERAVFKIRGTVRPERVKLPIGANTQLAKAYWNGELVKSSPENGRDLVLTIDKNSNRDFQILELRYHFTGRASSWSVTADLPSLQDDMYVEHLRWQIITPTRWNMMWGPSNMNLDANWQWNDTGWERAPTRDQAQLETLIGTNLVEDPVERSTYHWYVFSGIGKLQSATVTFVPRAIMLWFGAIVGFGLGWLVWNVRQVRHPLSIIAIGIALLLLGATFPDPLLIIGQGAILGIPMIVVAVLIRRILHIEKPFVGTKIQSESKITDRSATQLYTGPGVQAPAHSGSTATKGMSQKLERNVT